MIIFRFHTSEHFGYIHPENFRHLFPFFGGANMAFRRSCLAEIGGFNPQMKVGEDTDISLRVFKSPWKLFSMPFAVNYHSTDQPLWMFLKKCFLHGFYMAKILRTYNEKAIEVFVEDKNSSDKGVFTCVFFSQKTPVRAVVFVNEFLLFHFSLLLFLLFPSGILGIVLGLVASLFGMRYFWDDLLITSRTRSLLSNLTHRYLWNTMFLLGGVLGGIRQRLLLVNAAI